MNLSTFILIFVLGINFLLLLFILTQRKKQRFLQLFVMVLLITIWQSIELYTLLFLLDKDQTLLLAVRVGLLPALYFAPTFLWLAYSMFNKWNKLATWQQWLWFLPAIFMSPFVFSRYNVSEVVVDQGRALYVPGGLYWFFAFYFAALMIYGLYLLIVNRKNSNQIAKRQIDYIFVATAITAIAGILSGIILPLLGFIGTYYMAVNATIFFTLILTYALFRYRFFGLRASFFQVFFDLIRLFLTAIIFYALYFLLKDVTIVDFAMSSNMLLLFLFIGLAAPVIFSLINKLMLFLLGNPSSNIVKVEDSIANSLRSEVDINTSLSKLAHQIAKIVPYNDLHVYFSQLSNQDVFHQSFPVGDRTINRQTSLLVQYLEEHREILNVAEIAYINIEKDLIDELAKTEVDIILPIYFRNKLVGFLMIDNESKLLSIQQLNFLQQVNKYLDIAIGSFLLYQQALIKKV